MYHRKYVFGQDMVDCILIVIRDHLVGPLVQLVRACLITDRTVPDVPVTVFSADLFVESLDATDRDFFRLFMQTTMFVEFKDLILDEPGVSVLAVSDASDMTPVDS
jgi:hypothetical protein